MLLSNINIVDNQYKPIMTYQRVRNIGQSLHTVSKNVGLFLTDKTPVNELFNKAVPTEETEDWQYPSLFRPDDF